MVKENTVSTTRNNRTICLPFLQETYAECINNYDRKIRLDLSNPPFLKTKNTAR